MLALNPASAVPCQLHKITIKRDSIEEREQEQVRENCGYFCFRQEIGSGKKQRRHGSEKDGISTVLYFSFLYSLLFNSFVHFMYIYMLFNFFIFYSYYFIYYSPFLNSSIQRKSCSISGQFVSRISIKLAITNTPFFLLILYKEYLSTN